MPVHLCSGMNVQIYQGVVQGAGCEGDPLEVGVEADVSCCFGMCLLCSCEVWVGPDCAISSRHVYAVGLHCLPGRTSSRRGSRHEGRLPLLPATVPHWLCLLLPAAWLLAWAPALAPAGAVKRPAACQHSAWLALC